MNPNAKKAKVQDLVLTFGPLPILHRAPMLVGHLAMSRGEVSLSLVEDEVFLSEQSFQSSDLTLVPLGGGALLLGL